MFKIATWNVNSLKVRLPHVIDWLKSNKPEILALQETKTIDENFPINEINSIGYNVCYSGQKTYNGVATLSKFDIETIATKIPELEDEQRRVLLTKSSGISVLNLYIPNGAELSSDKYQYKLKWFSKLQPFVKKILSENKRLIVLGDFNIAPLDKDVHDPKKWEGNILVSEAERAEFGKLLAHGLSDCFRLFKQEEKSYSWWDYRAAAFRRNMGLRIDHILASQELTNCCKKCYIDVTPRKLERPSDHTPVVAEFEL